MKLAVIAATLAVALSGCQFALPNPDKFCGATPATQAWIAKVLNATIEDLTAACEIANN